MGSIILISSKLVKWLLGELGKKGNGDGACIVKRRFLRELLGCGCIMMEVRELCAFAHIKGVAVILCLMVHGHGRK